MRFWMRKQCFSSLRQGMLFQASLARSRVFWALGAFLSFILLVPFPSVEPCSRQRILVIPPGSSFLNNLSNGCMRLAPTHSIDRLCEHSIGFTVPVPRFTLL